MLERVSPEDWPSALKAEGDERREFFRAIDAVKKRWLRARRPVFAATDSFIDHREAADQRRADDREVVRSLSRDMLTARQCRILDLSFEGWSVQEIASELGLSSARVSDEKYKAVRKLRQSLGDCF
jgi:RNA polymerase sigma factor (sigma-70 family)